MPRGNPESEKTQHALKANRFSPDVSFLFRGHSGPGYR
jgi:hypothetical protein